MADFQVIDLLLQNNRDNISFLFDGSEAKIWIENKLNKKKVLLGTVPGWSLAARLTA